MQDHVYSVKVRDVDDLKQRLIDMWDSLEQSVIDDTIDQWRLGLPGVRFLTGQSGFLAICPVKNMMLNRTISCPVFGRP